jgi:hypothetical protein
MQLLLLQQGPAAIKPCRQQLLVLHPSVLA